MSYWNNNGKYEAEAAALNELVPMMGNCETFKGEVWRAATKIYHDYFNNGFCNEWTQPAAFLMDNVELSSDVKHVLLEYASGNMLFGANHEKEMEMMINSVIEQLRDVEDRPNQVDMWEYPISYKYSFVEVYEDEEEDEYCYDDEDY